MPKYMFYCPECDYYVEKFVAFKDIKLTEEIKSTCQACNKSMTRDYTGEFSTHSFCIEVGVLKPLEIGSHAEDWKKKRAADTQVAIADEGFRSTSELKEARDIATEEEKKRGKVPGSILGNVQAPRTKEEKEKVRIRDNKKKVDQRRARGIHN